MIQKSTVKGSQGGSGVDVIVGVTDGTVVAVGDDNLAVATIFVFTATTGVSVTPVVAQDTRIKDKRRFSICFIRTDQSLVNPLRLHSLSLVPLSAKGI